MTPITQAHVSACGEPYTARSVALTEVDAYGRLRSLPARIELLYTDEATVILTYKVFEEGRLLGEMKCNFSQEAGCPRGMFIDTVDNFSKLSAKGEVKGVGTALFEQATLIAALFKAQVISLSSDYSSYPFWIDHCGFTCQTLKPVHGRQVKWITEQLTKLGFSQTSSAPEHASHRTVLQAIRILADEDARLGNPPHEISLAELCERWWWDPEDAPHITFVEFMSDVLEDNRAALEKALTALREKPTDEFLASLPKGWASKLTTEAPDPATWPMWLKAAYRKEWMNQGHSCALELGEEKIQAVAAHVLAGVYSERAGR